jgi:hypothetical protein
MDFELGVFSLCRVGRLFLLIFLAIFSGDCPNLGELIRQNLSLEVADWILT